MKNYSLFLACLFFLVPEIKAQVMIEADHPDIIYWGRVDHSNPKAPAFEFSGVTIRAEFSGTSVSATLQDFAAHGPATTNYYNVVIDGVVQDKIEALAGTHTYALASGLEPGWHLLELVRLTEASVGRSAFHGLQLEAGQSLRPVSNEPVCEIEFIGNSITCGYGNEVSIPADPNTGFTSVNENNYKAWGYLTARNLGMRYRAVAYSGRGMYRNNTGSTEGTLPKIYDRIFPDAAAGALWNHAQAHPNVIVINLGTNDFAQDPGMPLDADLYKSTYVTFVERLRNLHPNAVIICATGVMMSDYYPVGAQHWTRIRAYVKDVVTTLTSDGMENVHYFEMDPQTAPYGEDWHPDATTHVEMANKLTQFITSLNVECTENEEPQGLDYSIANWLDNKKAAVALTFDDWTAGHPAIVVPELRDRDMHATFFLTVQSWNAINWSRVAQAAADGNEIANHSKTHRDLITLSAADKADEIRGAKAVIDQQQGLKAITFAYPFGSHNSAVIDSVRASGHIGARGVQPPSGNYGYHFASSDDDYYKIRTFSMDNTVTLQQYEQQLDNILSGGGLLTYLYHSVFNEEVSDNSYAMIHQDDLQKQLDLVKSREGQLWISTFAQAIQYHKEKKSAVLTELTAPFEEGDTWKLLLTDDLPDELYNQALTLRVRLPEGVTNILQIVQAGETVPFLLDGDMLQFNAVPDGGEVIIHISGCMVPAIQWISDQQLSFCIPGKAVIHVQHESGNEYEWFQDGQLLEGRNHDTLHVPQAGIFDVKITRNGCSIHSSTVKKSVVVQTTGTCGEPRARFTVDRNPALIYQTVIFTSLSENTESNASYTWSFGEEVLLVDQQRYVSEYTGAGPVKIHYTIAGTKLVRLVVSGSISNDTTEMEISVLDEVGCLMDEEFNNTEIESYLGGWNNYDLSVQGGMLRVDVPETNPNEWYAFTIPFRGNSGAESVDFSDFVKKPVVRLWAKASDTLSLKVSMMDALGVVTDGAMLSARNLLDVTTELQYFEIDFSGLFFNQWDEQALDSSAITALDFRINSGYESFPYENSFGQRIDKPFVGSLYLDWVGVNDDCEAPDSLPTSVVPAANEQKLDVYPVPSSGMVYLSPAGSDTSWTITTLMGKALLHGSGHAINIHHLPAGVYLLQTGSVLKKIIKQ